MSYPGRILGEKKLRKFVLIFLLLALTPAFVSGNEYEPQEKNPLWKEFMGGAFDPIIYFVGNFADRVLLVYSSFTPQIKETGELTYGDLEKYLLSNPQPIREVSDLMSYFISILAPLYVAAIILLGIYLIFFSGSPLGRAQAKSSLLRLILSLIIISITPAIIRLLFSLSTGLTQAILSLGPANFLKLHQDSIFYSLNLVHKVGVANVLSSLPFILFSLFLTVGTFLLLIMRYLLVLLLAVLFPPTIFLFSFKPTRNIGKVLLSQLFFWIFLPVSFAVALVAIAVGENLFHHILAELWGFSLGGTLALIFSPVGMFYATKGAVKVLEKISKKYSEAEKRIIPELEELTKRKISEKGVEAHLGELSKEGRINPAKLKQRKELYQQLQREAQDQEESVAELLREKYNFKLIQEREALKRGITPRKSRGYREEGYAPITPTKVPQPYQKEQISKESQKRRKGIVVKLGMGVKPTSASLDVENGTVKGVSVKIDNLTGSVLNEIALIDQGLAENSILVSYNTNNFSLKSGESKTILVKINVMEGTELKTYEGIIYVTCKEGFKNFIEVKVRVMPKEEVVISPIEIETTLKELANEERELKLEDLKEKEEAYQQLQKEAKESGNTLEEYVTETYHYKIVTGERRKHKGGEKKLIKPIREVRRPAEAPPQLSPAIKVSLVSLSAEGEINYAELKENAQLFTKISQAAEAQGKTLEEFVKDEYDLVVAHEEAEGDLCTQLSELANIDNEINLEQLQLKEDLRAQISKRAKEEEKSLPEYVKEKCGFIIIEEEREEEKPPEGERLQRAPTYTPQEIAEERKVEEEKESKEKLALPAPEAPPKIISP